MADPVVHITNGIPDSGTGNITTLGQLQIALLAALPGALGTSGGLKVDGSGTALPVSGTVTVNAGTNLNTSALAVESGGNLASIVTQLGAVTASPTANTISDRLKTINATLGSPLTVASHAVTNAGTFAVQVSSMPSVAVTNAGTFATQSTLAAETTKVIGVVRVADGSGNLITSTSNAIDVNIKSGGGSGGTSSAFAAAMPTTGTAIGLFDGTNMVRAKGDETNGIWVNIKAGAGSGGTSGTDEGSFTAGTSGFTPMGGFFQTTATSNALTTGQWGAWQFSANRAGHVNLRTAAGAEIGTAASNLIVGQATAANLNATVVGTGTFAVQAAQSSTWTVQPGNTANTTPWLTKLSDGTNAVAIKAASTAPAATDAALVVAISPNSVNANGSATSANSAPVVIASDQAAVAVKAASGAIASGAIASGAIASGAAVSGAFVAGAIADLAHGQSTMSGSVPVVIASNQSAVPTTSSLTASSNGLTKSRVTAAASTNATSLKGSAGNIVSIDVFNNAAYNVFLKLYNKASAPTVGTDTPVWTIPIAAGGGFSREFALGDSFATGIAYAITKLLADSDTTVLVAGDLVGQIRWI